MSTGPFETWWGINRQMFDTSSLGPHLAQSGLIKWIRDRIGLQQEEYVWASGLHERLVSEGIFAHTVVAFEMQREPLMARH
ncbi:hypothetical protein [Enterobacter sp. ku-bf2]|uniref:hypothetical protein n=1 Tax=Enterobacter sp. ku-bf2 TaxID=1888167 RepID=UPI00084F9309|nr:hypothetical protein [Enterobacter sp. ku-bf2]OEI77710.1 hypothetical protein BFG58_03975 [Enterobacter sp. ku-bf2]